MVGFRARALNNRCAAALLCGVSAAALLGLPSHASAGVDRYWDANATAVGSGGGGAWNTTSGFWSQSNDGVSGPYSAWNNAALDNAIFGGTTAGTVTLGAPITVGGLTFERTGYALNGGTLTLGGALPTITTNAGVTATINSILAGTAGLTKAGAGTLVLNGANSFTGDVFLNAGGLSLGGDAALGAASNRVVAAGGGSFLSAGALATNRVVELTGGVTSIGGAGVGSARFTGAGGLRVVQDVVLSNDANDFTGQVNFSVNGSAYFTSVGNVGEASSLGAGGTIRFTATNQYQDWLFYTGSGDSSNRNWEFATSGGTSGSVFVNNGTGTLTLTGNIAAIGATGTGLSFVAQKADMELLGEISSAANRNVVFRGSGVERTITLGNANTYIGTTGIGSGGAVTVRASSLADTGVVSSFGTGTAGGMAIYSDSVLSYIGAGASSNRAWTIGPAVAAGGMGGKISNDGTGALNLSGAVDFAAGPVGGLRLGGGYTGVNTLSGVISGNGALVSSGSGTWVLSGANTRTGAILVDGGTLRAGSASAFGTTTGVTVNGGTLDLNGFDLAATTLAGTGGVVQLGNATLSLGSTASTTFAGSIAGSGGLTKVGAGTLTLTGANTYSGDTTLNGGGLTLDFSAAGAPINNILSADTTLNLAGSSVRIVGGGGPINSQNFDGLNISAGSNRVVATGGDVYVNFGAINRTGGLIDFAIPTGAIFATSSTALGGWATVNQSDYAKVVGGIITAFEETDYNDKDDAATWLDGDIVSDVTGFFGTVGASTQLGGLRYTQAAATTVTIAGGQTLGTDGTIIVAPSVLNFNQLITGGALTGSVGGGVLGLQQNSGGNFTIASLITDNGGAIGFTKGGSGRATLTGANTYTGATTLSGGVLAINSLANGGQASSLGMASADASNLVLEGGTLAYVGAADGVSDRGFTLVNGGAGAPAIDVVTGRSIEFSGLATSADDAGLTKTGAGTLVLSNAANNYVGVTTVAGGTLSVNTLANGGEASGIGAASSDAANLILRDGGGLQYTGGTGSIDRGFTLAAGSGRIDVAQAGTTLTISGLAAGAGTLVKDGDGVLVLSGANSGFTGDTLVTAGTLRAGSAQAFGPGNHYITVNGPGTLDLGGFNVTAAGLGGSGLVLLGANTLTTAGGSVNFSGRITGSGGFTRGSGSYTQALWGCNNDYTGVTTVSGNLSIDCIANGGQASGIGASGAASTNLVLDGGWFAYSGGSATTDRGFTATSRGAYLNVTEAATTLEFQGVGRGSGGLNKDGAGTLVLSGANTYSGDTQVRNGILRAGSAQAFGTAAGMALFNVAGATLDLDGYDTSVAWLTGGGATGGVITLDGANLTITSGNNNASINYGGAITGAGALVKNGGATQRLSGCTSDYSGSTTINGGAIEVTCLIDGGAASSIGASGAGAANLILNGGTLRYVGAGGGTNRQFTLGASGGNALDASGSGAINFTHNGAVTFAAPNTAQTLTLTGTSAHDNRLGVQLTNNGTGVTSLNKTGAGTWILSNPGSTYTGVTTISGGVLGVDKLADGGLASSLGASSSAASNLVIGNGSTLRYTGAGDVTNRLFTLSAGVTFIESAGSGAIVFTGAGPVTLAGNNQARTIALGGSNTGDNTLAGSIGNAGTGKTSLAKNDNGTWVLTGTNTYTGNTVINAGLLKIGNGGTAGSILSDTFISLAGMLGFNRSDAYSYNGLISGAGVLRQIGSGVTTLTGDNSYTGSTFVDAGALIINGDQSAATGLTTVASGATLGGRGTIGGDVNVGNGTLAPGDAGAAGTLTINGDLLLGANSTLAMQFGQAGTPGGSLNDLIKVQGNLTLDGVLNVTQTQGGVFGPGVYRIIDYTGSLIDNGLNLGALPSGTGVIQTAVLGQVNLLAGGSDFSFWDGDAGPKFDGVVSGGSGLWQNNTGNNNWTESTGNLNAAFDDGSFAIFAGAAGVVAIDNSLGQVTAKGMQFATDGYLLTGGPLKLTDPQSVIRVGDGSTLGVAYTATIAASLDGAAQLVKTDAGRLVLSGFNTYTGGTAINGGVLQIFNNTNLGSAAGGLSFNGGTLNTTTTMTIGRDVVLQGDGAFSNTGTNLTLAGPIHGVGRLIKKDSGTLILTGDASHAGGTTIEGGVLQVGNGGTTGSISGDIVNGGVLAFQRGNAYAYGGSISGAGSLHQNGMGELTLSGDSTYAGSTYVNAGALMLTGRVLGSSALVMGDLAGQSAQMTVDGSSASFTAAGSALSYIGRAGAGALTVQNGGSAIFGNLTLGLQGTGAGVLNITDAGSRVATSTIEVGVTGTGTLNILNGGVLTSTTGRLGRLGVGKADTVVVSGPGSRWDVGGVFYGHNGSITISDGGVMTAGTARLGQAGLLGGASLLNMTVTGAGSRFETTGALILATGANDKGAITIADGGVVKAGDGTLAMGTGDAVLNIGGAEGSAVAGAGALDAAFVTMAGANNRINFNHDDADYRFSSAISGLGSVIHNGSGVTVLTGMNSYAGATTINAGSLFINGDQSGATGLTSVNTGATLGGVGVIGGDVVVADGGAINPGGPGTSPGTLSVAGDLTLSNGSALNFSFGQANVPGGPLNDLINVEGDLTLDGTLNVDTSGGGTLDPGVYRVFNYQGSLTDNGLTANLPSADFYVQTSVSNQVNLVNTAGLALRFWDGPAGKNDGIIGGGDGVWQAFGAMPDNGEDNWTEFGAVNAPFQDAAFAVFSGAAGTVTVDQSKGDINVSGMQFITDGYVVTGDAITLVGADSVIRVGDGTTGGAGVTARIDSILQGAGGLVKSDMGTLVLNGANTYAGGTRINGGTLRISDDANLGAVSGGVTFNGGVLHTTADLTSGRAFDFVSSGSILTDMGSTLTLTGGLSGAGRLIKDGDGTLVLAGAGGAGGFTAGSGVLLVNGDYSAMSGLSVVASGATLGGDGVIGGDVSIADGGVLSPGAGAPGTLTITGDLTLSSGSRLAFEFGEANVAGGALNDLVNVGGDLTLDGVLDVTVPAGGDFKVGVYRLFNYAGSLTNNGLTLGVLPGAGDASVQTSILGQINLVHSAGLELNFWDGAAGPKNDGVVNGGDGVWQASGGNDHWTDADGTMNAPYADKAFAVFGGVAGTVTVDGGLGDVMTAGMQFAAGGYVINGDALTLTQDQSVIRVGDGSVAGKDFTATINAVLQGAGQLVKTDAGTLILGGANTFADGVLINGGTVQIAADANLGAAAGDVTLDGGALATTADLTSQRDIVLAGAGAISTAADTTFTFDGLFSGSGALTKTGAGTLLVTGDSSGFAGAVQVARGLLALEGTLGGDVTVDADARLEGAGQMAGLVNTGVVAPGRDGVFGALTVTGDYEGRGGVLEIEAALGGDASATDRLNIGGNAIGSTQLVVHNVGGLGAQTTEGIKIIDVAGASSGTFSLKGDYLFQGQQAVIAGAYGYRLYQGGVATPFDGDWYLRSSVLNPVDPIEPEGPLYQPGVPIYEAYGTNLQAINGLPTFQQRVGGRTWAQGADPASGGGWSRVEGVRTRGNAAVSTSQAEQDLDSWKLQMGFDKVVAEAAWGGRLIAGVTAHYAEANSQIRSLFGNGVLETNGYGVGATLSWQGQAGLYLDSQAQVSWYQSDLESTVLGRLVTGNGGQGEAFSVEAGQRLPLTDKVSITPQAQLLYSNVRFDGFADAADAEVSLDRGESLKTRLGLSLDQHEAWEGGRGHVYAVANLSYEWMDPSRVDVSGASFEHANERLWGEVGIGFSATWSLGVTFFGETAVNSAIEDSESRSFRANAGVRIAF